MLRMAPASKTHLQDLIDRWKVEVEVDTYGSNKKSVALYGHLPTGVRILFGMIREEGRVRHVDDFVDVFLRDKDPIMAAALLRDVDTLLGELDEIGNYRFGPHD